LYFKSDNNRRAIYKLTKYITQEILLGIEIFDYTVRALIT